MTTDKNKPPAITPKVVAPRPDSPGRSQTTPPPPPPPPPSEEPRPAVVDEEAVAGMERASGESKVAVARAGAVKAAAAAVAAAKSARKKAAPSAKSEEMSTPANLTNEEAVPAEVPIPPIGGNTPPVGGSTTNFSMAGASGSTSVLDDDTRVVGTPISAVPESSVQPPVEAPAAASAAKPAESAAKLPAREDTVPRKVRLAVSKINPWSVMKLAFLLSVAVGIMMVVAVIVFWMVLDQMHVFAKINDFIVQVVGEGQDTNLMEFFEFSKVVSQTAVIAVVNVLLMTTLATIMAFLYNVTSSLVGGLHLTLTDD